MQAGLSAQRIASSSRCSLATAQRRAYAPCHHTRHYSTAPATEEPAPPTDAKPSPETTEPMSLIMRLQACVSNPELESKSVSASRSKAKAKAKAARKQEIDLLSLLDYKAAKPTRETSRLFSSGKIKTIPTGTSFFSAFSGAEVPSGKPKPQRKGASVSAVLSRGARQPRPPKRRPRLVKEKEKGKGKEKNPAARRFASDPEPIVAEDWAEEPWSKGAAKDTKAKRPPPHIIPTDPLSSGTIGTETGLLVDVAPKSEHLPVATLAHGLERVLFNPGVHWLRDPRSRVYNFTPWLEQIPKVNDFAFERLTGFIKSSRDEDLRALAVQEKKQFAGSTSSLSGMLSQIYFLMSDHKDVETVSLSQHFSREPASFTWGQRAPTAVVLNYKDGVYAIDSHSGEADDSDKNVLTWMGTLLENFLTKPPKEFKTFLKTESAPIEPGVVEETPAKPMREAYRYAKSEKIVMRSQLDCRDPNLPGTGVFDLKTRACVSIRNDILNYEENAGYMIKTQHGLLESFEKEYYDLIRSAFLKYSFQVRIGNMDGVMVAYHNTERIYGFQYISLDEMDERLYGPVPGIGDKIFKKSIGLLESILEEASALFPKESVICYFETPIRQVGDMTMDVFVEPETWDGAGIKPVEHLRVNVTHFLDGEQVKPARALASVAEEWTMKYDISKGKLPLDVVRLNLEMLQNRKHFSRVLPSHVEPEEAGEYWANLRYGNALSRAVEESAVSLFASPSSNVLKYRELSRQGRLEYTKLRDSEKGAPKILLGHGVYTGEEELDQDPTSDD